MHAHWLPGIDDGAETMEQSLAMIRRLGELGYRKLIATPHVMADLYPNTSATIRGKLEEVRAAAREAGIDTELDAAAEYLLDEGFAAKIKSGELLTLPGRRVLVELSFIAPPPNLDQTLFQLQTAGYRPILAHPERYLYYHTRFAAYEELHSRGIVLQVNLLSLTGYYGSSIQKIAQRLIKKNLVDFIGTDAHHDRHLDALSEALRERPVAKAIEGREWGNAALE